MATREKTSADKRLQKGENTRNRILQAAIQLFSEKGFDGTSVKDITDAAGIPKSLFYHYFNSMEELFFGIINASHIGISPEEKSPDRRDGDANPLIGLYVDKILGEMSENKDNLRIIFLEALKNKAVFSLFLKKLDAVGSSFDVLLPDEMREKYGPKELAVLRLYFRILPAILLVLTGQETEEFFGLSQGRIRELFVRQMQIL